MVTLLLDSSQLEVVLSTTERLLSFRKKNISIDRADIVKAQLTDDGWTWLRGVPSPGTHVPGMVAMGSWKSAAAKDFVLIRRHRPGVVLDLEGHDEFDRLVLTSRNGLALVQALRLEGITTATDVIDIVADSGSAPAKLPVKTPKPKPVPAS